MEGGSDGEEQFGFEEKDYDEGGATACKNGDGTS